MGAGVRAMRRRTGYGPLPGLPDVSLEDVGGGDWTELIHESTGSNIFHHPAWSGLIAASYGHRPFLLAVRGPGGLIDAAIPIMMTSSALTGSRWVSLPYSDHCRPVVRNPRGLERLMEGLAALPSATGIRRIEVRDALLPRPEFRSRSRHVLHVASLPPDPEALQGLLESAHRRNIAAAERRGVRIVRGVTREHVREFYRLHLLTRREQGVPVQPLRFFDRLGYDLLERGLGFILLAYGRGECLAGALFLHWRRTLTYKYGASRPESLSLRPNNLIFWTAMRWACDNGFASFDLGRTDPGNAGLRRFKSGWGAEETALFYTDSGTSQDAGRPDSLQGASILGSLIKRSPRWVCRGLGELLYKHFP